MEMAREAYHRQVSEAGKAKVAIDAAPPRVRKQFGAELSAAYNEGRYSDVLAMLNARAAIDAAGELGDELEAQVEQAYRQRRYDDVHRMLPGVGQLLADEQKAAQGGGAPAPEATPAPAPKVKAKRK